MDFKESRRTLEKSKDSWSPDPPRYARKARKAFENLRESCVFTRKFLAVSEEISEIYNKSKRTQLYLDTSFKKSYSKIFSKTNELHPREP